MPKINGNEIRPGYIIDHDGGLWVAVKVAHVKPGKGGAFAQVELKNIRDGRKLNERFRSADKVERVRLDQKDQQFLYESDGLLHFMDADTFEQVTIPADIFGERRPFLQDGMTIQVEYYEDEALNAQLPDKVTCTIVETEPAVKGQTAANSFKPAILDNGVRIRIPPFVAEGGEDAEGHDQQHTDQGPVDRRRRGCAGHGMGVRRARRIPSSRWRRQPPRPRRRRAGSCCGRRCRGSPA